MNKIVSFAQNREDILISGFFKDLTDGFYVDVGASHPDHFSVTKFFYDKGWHGINIEPNKQLYELLLLKRPRDININAGVSNKAGELTFREYPLGDGLSTFSKEIQHQYSQVSSSVTEEYKDYNVKVLSLKNIFQDQKPPVINFMKIDVEGFEYEVIEGNDWDKYRPQLLCIEAEHIVRDWRGLLKKSNYKKVFFDGLNEYYVVDEHIDLAQQFSYVQTILPSPIITPDVDEEFKAITWHARQVEQKLARQENFTENLRAEIYRLQMQIRTNKRIRVLFKQLAKSLDAVVLLQIEKLNKPPVHRDRPINISQEDPKMMLRQLQAYDFERYYGMSQKRIRLYEVISVSYGALRRMVRVAVRNTYRFIRVRKNV